MALDVIAAGFSRTGTFSLRKALELLGRGPCYHMQEVFMHPEHHVLWRAAAAGELDDWERIMAAYRAAADGPACLFWRELRAAYPDARVVLTVRDADDWYDSARATVYEAMTDAARVGGENADTRAALELARELVLDGFFAGAFEDREATIARYRAHNDAVQREVPAERLLVYQVREGWGPLCAFLGVPVPDAPFPHTNDRAGFRKHIGL